MNTQQTPADSLAIPTRSGSDNCLPVGTRLADFEITGIIGEGGFGIVYLAFDHSLRRTVAIKEYMPGALAGRGPDQSVLVRSTRHQGTFETGLKSFINEARLLARFDHPALVKVYRFWEENKTGYMAMRYYEGETLKAVVKNHPEMVNEAWLKSMLKPMLEALDALYKVQILHRDISPDNVMIQKKGDAVLLDFGSARQIIGDMTHALTVILKPGYAPVEQYADDTSMTQGPWTDIYALSAVVYFAILKRPPPTSVGRMIKDPIELLSGGLHSGYSMEFLTAIDKGLAISPEDRPQSIAEFRKLLGFDASAPVHMERFPAAIATWIESKNGKPKKGIRAVPRDLNLDAVTMSLAKVRPSNRRSWLLVISGVILMTLYGGYHFFNGSPAVASVAAASESEAAVHAPVDGTDLSLPAFTPDRQAAPSEPAAASASASLAAAKPVTLAAGRLTGTVRVRIKPWGTIMVDGKTQGVSPPLKQLRLPEGKHHVKITNPNFTDYAVEVNVSEKKPGIIEYDFSSTNKTNSTR